MIAKEYEFTEQTNRKRRKQLVCPPRIDNKRQLTNKETAVSDNSKNINILNKQQQKV